MFWVCGIFLILTGVWIFCLARWAGKRIPAVEEKFLRFKEGAELIPAEILDVKSREVKTPDGEKKVIRTAVVQFRREEEKKTVIHSCTEPFYRNYKRGDKVTLIFREETPVDRALISGDNRFEIFINAEKKLRLPAKIISAVSVIAGIVMFVLSAVMSFWVMKG